MAKPNAAAKSKVVGTAGGKPVTEADLDRMVAEAEAGYDVDKILARRRGRPPMGSGPEESPAPHS